MVRKLETRIEILLFKHHKRSISGSSGTPHGWFSDRDCYCFCLNKQSTVETNIYLEQSLYPPWFSTHRNVSTIFMKALFYRGPILELKCKRSCCWARKNLFPVGCESAEQVCECVLPTLFFIFHHQIFPNIWKYLQIFPNICKYFSPPNIFHHDPCDIQPPSILLFTKIIFVLLLRRRSGCWTLMLTSLPFESKVQHQPARQKNC